MKQYSLKELRARFEETQAETAKALEVSYQTYNSWENNPGIIKLTNLLKIAKHFKVSIDEIRPF
ncbi:helix-turn-helix transcriptional regulator [Helcococcus kunzii]|uniref:helix-turn-helix transcriptional regulator n=1 Tax=Helcococcus kunzii TaxID=40091 RepID=UPI0038A40CD1